MGLVMGAHVTILDDIAEFFTEFQKAIKGLEGQLLPTIQDVVFHYLRLLLHVTSARNQTHSVYGKVCEGIAAQFGKWKLSPVHLAAMPLTPTRRKLQKLRNSLANPISSAAAAAKVTLPTVEDCYRQLARMMEQEARQFPEATSHLDLGQSQQQGSDEASATAADIFGDDNLEFQELQVDCIWSVLRTRVEPGRLCQYDGEDVALVPFYDELTRY